jgi:hypothetical protein
MVPCTGGWNSPLPATATNDAMTLRSVMPTGARCHTIGPAYAADGLTFWYCSTA